MFFVLMFFFVLAMSFVLIFFNGNFNLTGNVILNQGEKVDNKVFKEIQEEGKARVFIELEEKSIFQKTLKIDIKQQIISSLGDKIKHDFLDSISAIVSEKDLLELEKNPNIKSIKLIGVKHIFLQDSVPLVNATDTWPIQVNNINITGIDETVCVLDTGVDFSNPGLTGKNLTCVIDCFSGSGCFENCSAGDFDGHGTHVSGIIGANGTLKGVAPDVNLIGVKVCGPVSCSDDDVKAGIDWCVTNSSQYNISVISMSLGSETLYSSYCDGQDDPTDITGGIDNAIANNISVIVSTGNDGNSTHIASPACIQNSTAVGSTTKSDAISSFSNRNNLTDLLAPGSSINSTYNNGAYQVLSGTSMSTPHVSGAFVLLRQFNRLNIGQILTSKEIETFLKDEGKQINDSSSGLNFSRINILSSIISLNGSKITLISPNNNTHTNINNTNFTCSSQTSSGTELVNLTFQLWNSTNNLIYNKTENVTGTLNQTTFNFTLINEIDYLWSCFAFDDNSNLISSDSNFSLTYDITFPNITLVNPADGDSSLTGTSSVDFEYNVSEINLANCSLVVNSVVDQTNNSINVNIANKFTKSLSAGTYGWEISCSDFAGNTQNSSSRSLVINSVISSSGGGSSSTSSVSIVEPSIYNIDKEQIEKGYSKILNKNDEVKFKAGNEDHVLTINSILSREINLTISSDPINLVLRIDELKKLNLNDDNYFDLELFLVSIINLKANLSIKSIHEEIPVKGIFEENKTSTSFNDSEDINVVGEFIAGLAIGGLILNQQRIIIIALIILTILVLYLLIKIKNKKK